MKKPIKTTLLAAMMALTFAPGLRADKGLVITGPQGQMTGFSFAKLQQVTFVNGQMMVQLEDGTEAVPLADIEQITFDEVAQSGTDLVSDLSDGLTLTVADGVATVSIADNAPLSVLVCAVNGRIVYSAETTGTSTIDLRREPTGIYIIKANNKLIKFTKQ